MSDSVRPHRRQPTRLLCPWDSPGKNTGVGCHFPFHGTRTLIYKCRKQTWLSGEEAGRDQLGDWTDIYTLLYIKQVTGKNLIYSTENSTQYSAAAAVSLQSCTTLCDPIDGSPLGSSVPHNFLEFAQIHIHESVMLCSHFILCCSLLFLPSIFPSISIFSNESALLIMCPRC